MEELGTHCVAIVVFMEVEDAPNAREAGRRGEVLLQTALGGPRLGPLRPLECAAPGGFVARAQPVEILDLAQAGSHVEIVPASKAFHYRRLAP